MAREHTVRVFDTDLQNLERLIEEMGVLCSAHLLDAVRAILDNDDKLADRIVRLDRKVDQLEQTVTAHAINMVALRQPVADDLRTIVSALKTATALERVGDYAKNIAKRSLAIGDPRSVGPLNSLGHLGDAVEGLLKSVVAAYAKRDVVTARNVIEDDSRIDLLHTSLFRELLTYMMEDPRMITTGIHLLFVAKNLERVGDQATNIAENIIYMVEGDPGPIDREKADDSSYLSASPPAERS